MLKKYTQYVIQFLQMEPSLRSITWEAPEHHHVEKGNDWFFALAIIVLSFVIMAILFNNVLFALLLGLAGGALGVSAVKRPYIIPFAVTLRGVRIQERLYPYSTLESFHIDEEDTKGPQLLLKTHQRFSPLLVIPIPVEHIDDIDNILKEKLEEEELQEPLLMKVLEILGF